MTKNDRRGPRKAPPPPQFKGQPPAQTADTGKGSLLLKLILTALAMVSVMALASALGAL